MKAGDPSEKILSAEQLRRRCGEWRVQGKSIVTTNGSFDIIHPGHIESIRSAASFGDVLIVGINTDASIKRYKAHNRPFIPQIERALQIACLPWVDAVHIFDEDTPDRFIMDARPSVHCKGSQYKPPIIEEPSVRAVGGIVQFLPMVEGVSTTDLSDRVFESQLMRYGVGVRNYVIAHKDFAQSSSADAFEKLKIVTADALRNGKTLFFCGNGGSAASAQHFSAEFIGRFKMERQALPAIALTVDTSIITSIGNDYGYDEVFARQLEGLGKPGDVLFCMSTSGGSKNVVRALEMALRQGMITVCFVGANKGPVHDLSQYPIVIPSFETTVIQEMTDHLLHRMCDEVERAICLPR
jgi:D-sedoheptulose 7-phosphate isomerase